LAQSSHGFSIRSFVHPGDRRDASLDFREDAVQETVQQYTERILDFVSGKEPLDVQAADHALHGTGTETFEAIDMLRKVDPAKYPPENAAKYPTSQLGQSLQQIGQLLKANIGVEVLFVDCGGWDMRQFPSHDCDA
jgi:hypothetical protein